MGQQHTIGRTATTVKTKDGLTRIQYHSTVVVEFDQEQIRLDSGGWQTATTKSRMNQASNQFDLGYRVFQKDFEWRVYVSQHDITLPFYDGMLITR